MSGVTTSLDEALDWQIAVTSLAHALDNRTCLELAGTEVWECAPFIDLRFRFLQWQKFPVVKQQKSSWTDSLWLAMKHLNVLDTHVKRADDFQNFERMISN